MSEPTDNRPVFPYLKKGSGQQRYNRRVKSSNDLQQLSSSPYDHVVTDSGVATAEQSPFHQPSSSRTEAPKQIENASPDKHLQQQDTSMSSTRQFEEIERRIANSSGDTSFNLQAPTCSASPISSNITHSSGTIQTSQNGIDANIDDESNKSQSTITNLTRRMAQLLAPLQRKECPIEAPKPSTSNVDNVILISEQNKPETPKVVEAGNDQNKDITVLSGHLKAALKRIDSDRRLLMQKEIDLEKFIENREQEILLKHRDDIGKLERDRNDFDYKMYRDRNNIKIERENLRKLRDQVNIQESEQVRQMRQHIMSLQNTIGEKDAKHSQLRAKIRNLEQERDQLMKEVETSKTKILKIETQNASLERFNAQLRCRNSKLTIDVAQQASRMSQPLTQIQPKSGNKSKIQGNPLNTKCVKFQRGLNTIAEDNENEISADSVDACLAQNARTSNTSSQTSFLVPNNQPQPYNLVGNFAVVREQRFDDCSVERQYSNGTYHLILPDNSQRFDYNNGDWRYVTATGAETYHYANAGVTIHTDERGVRTAQYSDDDGLLQSPSGAAERKDTVVQQIDQKQAGAPTVNKRADYEEIIYPSGTKCHKFADGTEVYYFTDKSVETRTKEFVKRVFENGDIKYVFADGQVLTKLSNGRVRIRNKEGTVLVDSMSTNDTASTATTVTSP